MGMDKGMGMDLVWFIQVPVAVAVVLVLV